MPNRNLQWQLIGVVLAMFPIGGCSAAAGSCSIQVEEATGIVMNDPFVSEDLLEDKWIKEWMLE